MKVKRYYSQHIKRYCTSIIIPSPTDGRILYYSFTPTYLSLTAKDRSRYKVQQIMLQSVVSCFSREWMKDSLSREEKIPA
jgi:hypothetical protein